MARQLFIGLITEGPTDVRFLQSVVERTFIDVAFECENDLEPYVKCLTVEKVRLSFNEYVDAAVPPHSNNIFALFLSLPDTKAVWQYINTPAR